LQFSQVREDPLIDAGVVRRSPGPDRHVMLVASAGCTALSLLTESTVRTIEAVDINPTQLALCRLKAAAVACLESPDLLAFLGAVPGAPLDHWPHVARELPAADRALWENHRDWLAMGVLRAGNYERLFAVWRCFLHQFVAAEGLCRDLFASPGLTAQATTFERFNQTYWPVGFTLAFHADFLNAMFGPKATQHAEGPYDRYFEGVFRHAITAVPVRDNYFLSQLLLDAYLPDEPDGLPPYLQPRHLNTVRRGLERIRWRQGTFPAVLGEREGPPLAMVQLSNILDWCTADEGEVIAAALIPHLLPGARLLVRQLNNTSGLPQRLNERLQWDAEADRTLQAAERSFFYNRVAAPAVLA
jgi:S-adenosylmethionine-diacylglycerol 3-amino-3-carboxypropyl transferase